MRILTPQGHFDDNLEHYRVYTHSNLSKAPIEMKIIKGQCFFFLFLHNKYQIKCHPIIISILGKE